MAVPGQKETPTPSVDRVLASLRTRDYTPLERAAFNAICTVHATFKTRRVDLSDLRDASEALGTIYDGLMSFGSYMERIGVDNHFGDISRMTLMLSSDDRLNIIGVLAEGNYDHRKRDINFHPRGLSRGNIPHELAHHVQNMSFGYPKEPGYAELCYAEGACILVQLAVDTANMTNQAERKEQIMATLFKFEEYSVKKENRLTLALRLMLPNGTDLKNLDEVAKAIDAWIQKEIPLIEGRWTNSNSIQGSWLQFVALSLGSDVDDLAKRVLTTPHTQYVKWLAELISREAEKVAPHLRRSEPKTSSDQVGSAPNATV